MKNHNLSLHTEGVSPTDSKHILSTTTTKEERKPKYGGGWVGVFVPSYMLPFFKNVATHSIVMDKIYKQLLQLLPCISDHNNDSLPLPQWQTI